MLHSVAQMVILKALLLELQSADLTVHPLAVASETYSVDSMVPHLATPLVDYLVYCLVDAWVIYSVTHLVHLTAYHWAGC